MRTGTTILAVAGGAAAGGIITWLLVRRGGPLSGVLGADAKRLPGLKEAAGIHIRQIRRYAFAASQDKSPVVGLTHASYALVLLDTLEEVAGREAVAKTGVDPQRLREFITKLQDMHAEKLAKCDEHLQQILAIERREKNRIPGFVVAGGAAPRGA